VRQSGASDFKCRPLPRTVFGQRAVIARQRKQVDAMSGAPTGVLITAEQIRPAGELLAQAFCTDPLNVYTQPDPDARISQFTWLFTQLVQAGAQVSAAYVNTQVARPDGVAVWTPPTPRQPTAELAAWNEMEQRFGPEAYRRFTEAYRCFDHVHHLRMPGPHWYLALLGVSPPRQRQGIGGALLIPVLQQADREGLPCYLETFVAGNVPFYEQRGFQVVEAGVELQSPVPYWAMRRDPLATS
jgi:GNAT superfamily N-acetyltransferase